jgi:hypothetical protein
MGNVLTATVGKVLDIYIIESWRTDELEEELGKWGAWFSPSTRRIKHGK